MSYKQDNKAWRKKRVKASKKRTRKYPSHRELDQLFYDSRFTSTKIKLKEDEDGSSTVH